MNTFLLIVTECVHVKWELADDGCCLYDIVLYVLNRSKDKEKTLQRKLKMAEKKKREMLRQYLCYSYSFDAGEPCMPSVKLCDVNYRKLEDLNFIKFSF